MSFCDIIRVKGPPHVGRSNIAVPSIKKSMDYLNGWDENLFTILLLIFMQLRFRAIGFLNVRAIV